MGRSRYLLAPPQPQPDPDYQQREARRRTAVAALTQHAAALHAAGVIGVPDIDPRMSAEDMVTAQRRLNDLGPGPAAGCSCQLASVPFESKRFMPLPKNRQFLG